MRPAASPAARRGGRFFLPYVLLVLPVVVLLAGCGGPAAKRAGGEIAGKIESSFAGGTDRFYHAEWNRLLADGTRDGLVDYGFMQEHRDELETYLSRISEVSLERLAPPHLEALLINAYNAYTMQSILDHPHVSSIREISGVWTRRKHEVGGFGLTLDDIQHQLLRPFFKDPRIHFVVNCASHSCAPLTPWAVDGETIDGRLDELARAFLRSPRNVRLEEGTLHLSRFFDWYADDFTNEGWPGAAASVGDYVARYAPEEIAQAIRDAEGGLPIAFIEYDWSLNAATAPDPSINPSGQAPERRRAPHSGD